MDTEQQIRLNFLDEAEEYFNSMESNLLDLSSKEIDARQVDLVLRSAHSIKGGAAMMNFNTLSKVAHRLEDFLKILRVRYASAQIATEVETLLLQSIDLLRDVSEINRQGVEVSEEAISDRSLPIFEHLKEYLGELEEADEDALMSQDEDTDPALLLFEEGVDKVLDRFENRLQQLSETELAEELASTADELMGFGNMANLEPFIQLCESVQQQTTNSTDIEPLAEEALKVWRRSHALVLRGKIDKLPSNLQGTNTVETVSQESKTDSLQSAFGEESLTEFDPLAEEIELSGLQSAFGEESEAEFDPLAEDIELGGLQSAFGEESSTEFDPLSEDIELGGLQSAFGEESATKPATPIQLQVKETQSKTTESIDKMVRVPASLLRQFNNLFEQLILDRNTINSQVQQFQNIVSLLSERMSQMELSNTRLKQWYDRASIEGLLNARESTNPTLIASVYSNSSLTEKSKQNRFDTLEMDRYSDVHLICQEQIETIVQLQEVATDIELGLQEINQAVRNFNYTTKSMQGNVTRTQMLPFAEIVKRFPRVIRDLNLQFNKQVELEILGENTLLDRSVVEALGDPLMHLLRNSFDHGIEDREVRLAAGKPATGKITIQANSRGTYTEIAIRDDGAGISLDKIRDRAMQLGISREEVEQIPEEDLLNFIFEPGFSTAKQVTELSGRGVGMDVVRTNIEAMRGKLKVDTKLGKGTTFTLQIPFTLSILKVAIIEQAGIILAIPANTIRELLPLDSATVNTVDRDRYLVWNEQEISLVTTEKTLVYRRSRKNINSIGNPAIDRPMVLVIGDSKTHAALEISRFWQEQESTIRSIDSLIPLPPGVISSVVFGDGKVIPLFDPMLLIEECLQQQDNRQPSQPSEPIDYDTSDRYTERTILIVDDSVNVRRYLSLTLEKVGYRVEEAKDGREAVDKLLEGLAVDAVICDIEMPRLDGYGVLEEIKERPEFADLPIAMLTSRSNEKHRKLAMNLGASAYFSKPYNEQELLDELNKLLTQARLLQEPS